MPRPHSSSRSPARQRNVPCSSRGRSPDSRARTCQSPQAPSRKACSCRKSPPTPAQPATAKTGLSPGVAGSSPSLPSSKLLQIKAFRCPDRRGHLFRSPSCCLGLYLLTVFTRRPRETSQVEGSARLAPIPRSRLGRPDGKAGSSSTSGIPCYRRRDVRRSAHRCGRRAGGRGELWSSEDRGNRL